MSDLADELYTRGVAAIRAGDREAGREHLLRVVEIDPLREDAWLWLSAAVESDEDRITCLLEALAINPNNEATRLSLHQLGQEPPEPPPKSPEPPPKPPPEPIAEGPPTAGPPAEPSPPLTPSPLLDHASPPAIDDDMLAVLTGESPGPVPPTDESWRKPLLDPEAMTSDGAFAPPIDLAPERTLGQLVGVWIDLFLLTAFDEFRKEVAHGGFGHVAINLAVAGLMQVVGIVTLLVMLVVLPARGFRPPIYESLGEFSTDWQQMVAAAQPGPGGTVDTLTDTGFLPFDPVERITALVEVGSGRSLIEAIRAPALLAAGYFVLSVPLFLVWLIFYSTVVNAMAGMVGGHGDSVQTLHALSLALVVTHAVQLPLAVATPFLPLAVVAIAGAAIRVYQIAATAVAVGAVQRVGLLAAIGVLIMSGAVVAVLGGVCWVGFSLLAGVG